MERMMAAAVESVPGEFRMQPSFDSIRPKIFISYSWSADAELATFLMRAIETSYVQSRAGISYEAVLDKRDLYTDGKWMELPATERDDLEETLRQKILTCDYLILLASPSSKASSWVNYELECWNKLKPKDNIIAFITHGNKFSSIPNVVGDVDNIYDLTGSYDKKGSISIDFWMMEECIVRSMQDIRSRNRGRLLNTLTKVKNVPAVKSGSISLGSILFTYFVVKVIIKLFYGLVESGLPQRIGYYLTEVFAQTSKFDLYFVSVIAVLGLIVIVSSFRITSIFLKFVEGEVIKMQAMNKQLRRLLRAGMFAVGVGMLLMASFKLYDVTADAVARVSEREIKREKEVARKEEQIAREEEQIAREAAQEMELFIEKNSDEAIVARIDGCKNLTDKYALDESLSGSDYSHAANCSRFYLAAWSTCTLRAKKEEISRKAAKIEAEMTNEMKEASRRLSKRLGFNPAEVVTKETRERYGWCDSPSSRYLDLGFSGIVD